MGRHYKGVADILALFHRAAEVERQWAAYAATLPDDDKRQLFRQWWAEAEAAQAAGRYVRSCPGYLRGLTCGARKKDGRLCRSTTLCANGRCKFHGGASTGPRSPEGRARALENLKLGRLKRGDSWS
ncbi:HGGxSTG domain-containing protein [Sphingobium sp. Cam5-1]|uniref:HGGxSTG domain-containing protein n=1 Tax=Sphingobium sp. Cam5-1 TaxID=2789327 RepID=UPI002FE7BB53